tara:strand:+ start:519 stop:1244 length:726 start_codon:yes stop_codon:yes gene_type:complete
MEGNSMSDLTFKEIWETLSAVDVSDYTEEKMKLTYLSWARAWMLLMRHYPQAEYTFVDFEDYPYRPLPDGTGEVITSVEIEGHVRGMSLPIMDYKNNPVVNPNARQVNDNRMRCLVKNIAMFGLGLGVFAVWDDHLPSEEKDVQPTKKKEKTEDKKKKQLEPELAEEDYDKDWAETFVEGMSETLVLYKTREELASFWKANNKEIGKLKSDFPDLRRELDEKFKERSEAIKEKPQTNDNEE